MIDGTIVVYEAVDLFRVVGMASDSGAVVWIQSGWRKGTITGRMTSVEHCTEYDQERSRTHLSIDYL